MNNWVYSDEVKQHFFNPKNVLYEDESQFRHNARGMSGNVICGDQMLMLLQIENDIITNLRWKTYGCASAIASTSMLSEVAKGMNIFEAFQITPQQVADQLGGLPPHKFHCSVMGDEALQDAINNYLTQTNRPPLQAKKQRGAICPSQKSL
jgi:nitrogen fixation NifU-like protein